MINTIEHSFLHDWYFVWKYTQKNRLATTRKHLEKYIDEDRMHEGKRARALEMLLRVLYIDLSGVEGMQWYDMYRQGFYNQKEVRECFNIAMALRVSDPYNATRTTSPQASYRLRRHFMSPRAPFAAAPFQMRPAALGFGLFLYQKLYAVSYAEIGGNNVQVSVLRRE